MKKILKWSGIGILGLIVLIIAALVLIPMFVDIQDYKPRLETLVSEQTGRDFRIGGDLELSLFPWVGVVFADLTLGNPDGYEEKNFLSVSSFDVQVKLLPLLSRDVEIKRFVIEGLTVALERSAAGKGNWEGLEGGPPADVKSPAGPAGGGDLGDLPIKSLQVEECAVKGGTVLWIDHGPGTRKTLSDLNLDIKDLSLDRPIQVALSGMLDGKSLSVNGSLGPLGSHPGKEPITVDLAVKAFNHLDLGVNGTITVAETPRFDMTFQLSPFSPRRLLSDLSEPFPVDTADPAVLDKLAVKGSVNGSVDKISVTDGELILDDSRISFSMDAGEFEKPVLSFNIEVDSINLDRYLPPPGDDNGAVSAADAAAPAAGSGARADAGVDYAPLRNPVMNGTLLVGDLTVQKAKISDLNLKLAAAEGRYAIDPIDLTAYDGTLKGKALLDVRKDTPSVSADLTAQGIQVEHMLWDVLDKDFLAGTLKTGLKITFAGDDAASVKRTLNGRGELMFQDGAIVGIDLAGMVRNVTSAFRLSEIPAEKPRTDFSELTAPFTINNGLVNTPGTTMQSPLLRLLITGDANLVTEALDMRVEPKVVATLKGQGDVKERSGITVPVLVTGSFSEPRFRPDLKSILQQGLPKADDLKKMVPETGDIDKEALKDAAKELLKGLPFGKGR